MRRVCWSSLESNPGGTSGNRRHGFFVALLLLASLAVPLHAAAEAHEFPAWNDSGSRKLTIYGSMDIGSARPLIEHYQRLRPTIAVTYHELDTLEIYSRLVDGAERGEPTADILLSPAMDLQVKLANDGYVRQYASQATAAMPEWSQWRREVFGFSFEPAVLVYNKTLLAADSVPTTRAGLQALIENNGEDLFGRITTYDIERSGLGFLFLTQDALRSEEIWSLVNAMGGSSTRLYTNTAAMLDHIASGKYIIGYNLLGSYAEQRAEQEPNLGVVLPDDYTLMMTRTAVLPALAKEPRLAEGFLEFLLSKEGQTTVAGMSGQYALHPDIEGDHTASDLRNTASNIVPIKMGPTLIVYLDRAKRQRFLSQWQTALRSQ